MHVMWLCSRTWFPISTPSREVWTGVSLAAGRLQLYSYTELLSWRGGGAGYGTSRRLAMGQHKLIMVWVVPSVSVRRSPALRACEGSSLCSSSGFSPLFFHIMYSRVGRILSMWLPHDCTTPSSKSLPSWKEGLDGFRQQGSCEWAFQHPWQKGHMSFQCRPPELVTVRQDQVSFSIQHAETHTPGIRGAHKHWGMDTFSPLRLWWPC